MNQEHIAAKKRDATAEQNQDPDTGSIVLSLKWIVSRAYIDHALSL